MFRVQVVYLSETADYIPLRNGRPSSHPIGGASVPYHSAGPTAHEVEAWRADWDRDYHSHRNRHNSTRVQRTCTVQHYYVKCISRGSMRIRLNSFRVVLSTHVDAYAHLLLTHVL